MLRIWFAKNFHKIPIEPLFDISRDLKQSEFFWAGRLGVEQQQ